MTTYTALIANIQAWTEDDSTEFTASLPEIVAKAEDRIMADVPYLPAFRTSVTGVLVSGTATITNAAIIRAIRSVHITVSGSEVPLEQRSEGFIRDYAPSNTATAQPIYFALDEVTTAGSVVLFGATPDAAYPYTMRYRGMWERLATGNINTGLGDSYPALIHKATMIEAAIFLEKEQDTMQVVVSDYKDMTDKLAEETSRGHVEEGSIGA
tara:strand:+ start:1195 stop:1827 length:633 start_codon:yes stop_codon:yes gene_type:complete